MSRRLAHAPRTALLAARRCHALALLVAVTACTDNTPSGPATQPDVAVRNVTICHLSSTSAEPTLVDTASVALHLAHGDYFMTMWVNPSSAGADDSVHFRSITSAVDAARAIRASRIPIAATACPLNIVIDSGTYRGSATGLDSGAHERFPIMLDFSGIALHGAPGILSGGGNLGPGLGAQGGETILMPNVSITDDSTMRHAPLLVVNGHPGEPPIENVVVEDLVFNSGRSEDGDSPRGLGLLALRARDLTIRDNRFDAGFLEAIDLRASSAVLDRNLLMSGGADGRCGVCLAGPGTYSVTRNHLLASDAPGIVVTPATQLPVPAQVEPYVLPGDETDGGTSAVTVYITNNAVYQHRNIAGGVAIHLAAVGMGATNVQGQIWAQVTGNTFFFNNFAIVVDGGYTEYGAALTGNITASLAQNVFTSSCERDLVVSTGRNVTSASLANAPYLRESIFQITLNDDVRWGDAWFNNPDGFGNALYVDGTRTPNGTSPVNTSASPCLGH